MGFAPEQRELIIGDSIRLPELQGMSYDGLFDDYALSIFGQHHQTQTPRFSKNFGYDPSMMVADLGDDVDPLLHGLHTRVKVFEPLVYFQNVVADEEVEKFTPREIAVGRLATQFHDIGECEHPEIKATMQFVVGDIARTPDQGKDLETEAKESKIRRFLFKTTVPALEASGLIPETEQIIQDEESGLVAKAFAVTEILGYYLTGLRAARLALLETQHRNTNGSRRDNESYVQLMAFAQKVPVDWLPHIQEAAQDFPYARYTLDTTLPYLDYVYREHGWGSVAAQTTYA